MSTLLLTCCRRVLPYTGACLEHLGSAGAVVRERSHVRARVGDGLRHVAVGRLLVKLGGVQGEVDILVPLDKVGSQLLDLIHCLQKTERLTSLCDTSEGTNGSVGDSSEAKSASTWGPYHSWQAHDVLNPTEQPCKESMDSQVIE